MRKLLLVGSISLVCAALCSAETIRFVDGTTLDVSSVDVRDSEVVFMTSDGKLHSVPREHVVEATVDAPSVSRLIEMVGLRNLIDEIAHSAESAASSFGDGIVDAEALASAVKESFGRDRLYAVASTTFRQRAAELEVGPAIEWLASSRARGMRRFELAPSGASYRAFLERLAAEPPSIGRVELVMRLDRATGATRSATDMQMALLTALLRGLAPADGSDDARVSGVLAGMGETLRAETESRLRLSLLYTYRDVTDDELARYVAHLESSDGAWIRDVLLKSVFTALQDGARRAGEIIARRIALEAMTIA